MDAISLLKQDHKAVEGLFKQFEKLHKKGGSATEKKKVVSQIIKELSVHAAIEEEVFYPRVREQMEQEEDTVLESLEEHHIVKTTLAELERLSPSDERYDAKVTVLIESVRHHVKEEEQEMFPEVREAIGRKDLAELGAELEKLKKKAPTKPHPMAPDEPPANKIANRAAGKVDRVTTRGKSRRRSPVSA